MKLSDDDRFFLLVLFLAVFFALCASLLLNWE